MSRGKPRRAASGQVSHATQRLSPVSVSPGGACSTATALHFIALMGSSTRRVSSRLGLDRAEQSWAGLGLGQMLLLFQLRSRFVGLVKFSRSLSVSLVLSLIAACHSPRFCFINKDIKSAVMFGHVNSDLLRTTVWQRGAA